MYEIWFPRQDEWPDLHIYVISRDVIINGDPRIDQTFSLVWLYLIEWYSEILAVCRRVNVLHRLPCLVTLPCLFHEPSYVFDYILSKCN